MFATFSRWTRDKNIAQSFPFLQPTFFRTFSLYLRSENVWRLLKFCISNLAWYLVRSLSQIFFKKTCRKKLRWTSWNYQTKKYISKKKKKLNAIITQAYQSRCSFWKPSSKARIVADFFNPPTHPARLGRGSLLKMMPSENGFPVTWKSGAFLNQKINKETSHE